MLTLLTSRKLIAVGLSTLVVVASGLPLEAHALSRQTNTLLKHSAIGAGAGAAVGGLSREQSAGKGALYGGLAGLGSGLIQNSNTMQRNDGIRRTATGAVIGAGAGGASGKGTVKGGLIGAGAGLGWHLLKRESN